LDRASEQPSRSGIRLATLQVRTDRPLNIEDVYSRFKKELGDVGD
jgi:hypothetical protein